ncbi:hypothetical protein F4861DRAFT_531638 [Xylaria intraflava]|nr:hypothetical protein F4861DRAFT_531638 [Xylaria intraflava]
MVNSFPGVPRSVGGPSPPPSVGRSSTYARSESGRSIREENPEAVLGEHYITFRRYLTSTSKDGRVNPNLNKARDKLLKLSSVQFFELSTDVYDELMRRQAKPPAPGVPPNNVHASYLLPEPNFHPKRNQARQKLSTLGSPRFRDLATDVFCELERRIPGFVASVTRNGPGAPPSRAGTPVNGMGFPRAPSGMRRPSDASSIRSAGPPRVPNEYPIPPSPGRPPNGNFERPLPKQFQSNTIVPNKSTMLEEDDDTGSNDDENQVVPSHNRDSQRDSTARASEVDRKSIDNYQKQVQELSRKIEGMEIEKKKTDEELIAVKDSENSRIVESTREKEEWNGLRTSLVGRLSEAEKLNNSMRDELERLKDEHAVESRALQEQIEEARRRSETVVDPSTVRENEELRLALQEQQQVTEEARREARQCLEEMRALSLQHMPSWERQTELEKTVEQLEQQVRDWRNRYARAKTQLRSMRASSIGLTIDQDAGQYVRDHGFTEVNGLVKDVHVTKFQISIDELLRCARTEQPDKIIDSMKLVIANVRRIIKDMEDSPPEDEELAGQRQRLKSRVSATANNLITASKNFASSAGLSPVSLLDAAASHLVAALVELLRFVKIRVTSSAELEDDDDGSVTPVESTGFSSHRTTTTQPDAYPKPVESPLAPPPSFQDVHAALRDSTNSSAYSPYNSPRESTFSRGSLARPNGQMNGNGVMAYSGPNKTLPPAPNSYEPDNAHLVDLKVYLEDQTAILVHNIQEFVGSIRRNAPIEQINKGIESIADVVDKVVSETEDNGITTEVEGLAACRQRLLEAGDHGKNIAAHGLEDDDDLAWRMWTQTLPPIAFEIVRETKELVQRIDHMASPAAEEFS